MEGDGSAIVLEAVSKQFGGHTAVSDVNLSIRDGTVVLAWDADDSYVLGEPLVVA